MVTPSLSWSGRDHPRTASTTAGTAKNYGIAIPHTAEWILAEYSRSNRNVMCLAARYGCLATLWWIYHHREQSSRQRSERRFRRSARGPRGAERSRPLRWWRDTGWSWDDDGEICASAKPSTAVWGVCATPKSRVVIWNEWTCATAAASEYIWTVFNMPTSWAVRGKMIKLVPMRRGHGQLHCSRYVYARAKGASGMRRPVKKRRTMAGCIALSTPTSRCYYAAKSVVIAIVYSATHTNRGRQWEWPFVDWFASRSRTYLFVRETNRTCDTAAGHGHCSSLLLCAHERTNSAVPKWKAENDNGRGCGQPTLARWILLRYNAHEGR
jgi:hypothetical protein